MFVDFSDVWTMAAPGDFTEEDAPRVDGWIRRAERSLAALLLGSGSRVDELASFDAQLVKDTIVDAVLRFAENPKGLQSESDGDYSYQRFAKGSDGFWWPADWRALFGLGLSTAGRVATIPVGISCRWQGWAR